MKETIINSLLNCFRTGPKSLLTLHGPKDCSLEIFHSCLVDFLHKHEFGTYFYFYETGSSCSRLNVHLVTSFDYHSTFFNLNKSWSDLLNRQGVLAVLREHKIDNLSILTESFDVIPDSLAEFGKEFSDLYTHQLPLFQISPLLRKFSKYVQPGNVEWRVFDLNIIRPRYMQTHEFRVDSKVLATRNQFVVHQSSLLANFTHSLDAFVLHRLFVSCDFPIMSIHDSYGVHGCNVEALRSALRLIYDNLRQTGYKFFVDQMSDLIGKSASLDSQKAFVSYVEKNIKLGELTSSDVINSYNLIVPS